MFSNDNFHSKNPLHSRRWAGASENARAKFLRQSAAACRDNNSDIPAFRDLSANNTLLTILCLMFIDGN
jgi:hypothetical protein